MGLSSQLASSSLARPGVCTSSTRPASPFTGQVIYETDTGYLRVWDGAAWDYFSPKQDTIPGAYTTFTPTWTNVTTTTATQNFKYSQINKMVHVYGRFTLGSSSAITGSIRMNLPVTASNTDFSGVAQMGDNGINLYPGILEAISTTVVQINVVRSDGTYSTGPATSGTVPFTWANLDYFIINMTYEAA